MSEIAQAELAGHLSIRERAALFTELCHAQRDDDQHKEARILRQLHQYQHDYGKRHVPIVDRFFGKIVMGTVGCWIWTAALDGGGYGIFNAPPENRAHRVSWTLFNGPVPSGMNVLHMCDVSCCVNPEHLFLGSQQDNIADMKAKGRARGHGYTGEEHPAAKLTWEEVHAIRKKYAAGYSQHWLAAEYGMSVMPINRIVRHISWRENEH